MNMFPEKPRLQFEKIIAQLEDESEGVRLAAAAAAIRILQENGLRWCQVLTLSQPPPSQPVRPPEPPLFGWRRDLAAVQRATHRLTPWEQNFVSSVAMQRGISAKQVAVLSRLAAKVRG